MGMSYAPEFTPKYKDIFGNRRNFQRYCIILSRLRLELFLKTLR